MYTFRMQELGDPGECAPEVTHPQSTELHGPRHWGSADLGLSLGFALCQSLQRGRLAGMGGGSETGNVSASLLGALWDPTLSPGQAALPLWNS